jgi:hypothetical protein
MGQRSAMAEHEEDDDDSPLTVGDFHQVAQKQVMNAVFATLAESKMSWNLVAPFLEAGRAVCAGDFAETARVRLHTQRAEGETWIEAEEAFLGISVSDRDDGEEWLSETYWLSDIATADGDRGEVEAIIAGLERTVAKLRAWLENGGGSPPEAEPPPEEPEA